MAGTSGVAGNRTGSPGENENITRRALVTGASSGIGAAFAERLARDGYDLVVVARNRERLEELERRLPAQYGHKVDVLAADLLDPTDLHMVEQRIADDSELDLLINNAGMGYWAHFVDVEADRVEAEIRLNVLAVTRLTHAALPPMIARGRGAIINVSSSLSFRPIANFAVYCATKAYVNALTQALDKELAGTGVNVQLLSPGRTRSEFYDRSGRDFSTLREATFMEPEDVVEGSLAGLRSGELFCVPGLEDAGLVTEMLERQGEISLQTRIHLAPRYVDGATRT